MLACHSFQTLQLYKIRDFSLLGFDMIIAHKELPSFEYPGDLSLQCVCCDRLQYTELPLLQGHAVYLQQWLHSSKLGEVDYREARSRLRRREQWHYLGNQTRGKLLGETLSGDLVQEECSRHLLLLCFRNFNSLALILIIFLKWQFSTLKEPWIGKKIFGVLNVHDWWYLAVQHKHTQLISACLQNYYAVVWYHDL